MGKLQNTESTRMKCQNQGSFEVPLYNFGKRSLKEKNKHDKFLEKCNAWKNKQHRFYDKLIKRYNFVKDSPL